ncbi:hypothetical protein M5K25_010906 [Dendrobium thyrsiflorum]|uniref:Uncharacterized protein n=1 Tax=Dendrobium thyrsiflorum TaxID=117978 RepID=A0ABD0V8J5_DENTH
MGFIYNGMDKAKELIAHNLGGEEASYREIWDIIDARWEVQLHRHLHAAANYLNPQFQYSERKSSNPKVKLGLYHCMERLIPDQSVRELVDLELVLFQNREEFFGLQAARSTIVKRSPIEWWIQLVIPPLSYRVLQLEFWASLVLLLGVSKIGAHIVKCKRREEIAFQHSE